MAVLNRDDVSYDYLSWVTTVRQVSYGLGIDAQVRGVEIENTPQGLRFQVEYQGQRWQVATVLLGDFNVSNCLAAFAATVAGMGISADAAVQGIASLQGIPWSHGADRFGPGFFGDRRFCAHTCGLAARAASRTQDVFRQGDCGFRISWPARPAEASHDG